MKKIWGFVLAFVILFLTSGSALAHVVVRPSEVGVGQRLNFTVSVPTEEDNPTTLVRLVIPETVKSVRPNVKPGWTIQIKKIGEGENERVSEIVWSGGKIPADQRDEFVFSAQAPAEESTLQWKAYQTYSSGLVVAWDGTGENPYSETKIINDLTAETINDHGDQAPIVEENKESDTNNNSIAIAALALAVVSTGLHFVKRS